MRLLGRFLLWFTNAKSAQSFFCNRNSREVESSNGRISFFLLRLSPCGFTSFACQRYKPCR